MSLLGSIIGSVLGNHPNAGALQSVLGSILAGGGGAQGGGLAGLVERFAQAGLGSVAGSWVSNQPNQPVHPEQLRQVFGDGQISQWSQQSGMSQDNLLAELSQLLPHAVDRATPNGQLPAEGESPFDQPGLELPGR